MKKSFLMGGAALLMLAMASCANGENGCNGKACGDKGCKGKADKESVYMGLLPAADCAGVLYSLQLDYDQKDNDGDYDLIEIYVEEDSTSTLGYKEIRTFTSEGNFTVEKKADKTYLKLIKDVKDSQSGSADTPIYLLVDSDSTLTLTNEALEVSTTPGMNYTLDKLN